MDIGKVRYHVVTRAKVKAKDFAIKTLTLTLIDSNDEHILSSSRLSELRKKRIMRLTNEAQKQGLLLSYEDLNTLLLSSISTLKRDVNYLEKKGYVVPLKGRRK